MGDPRVQGLLDQLDAALKANERGDAIDAYEQLEALQPGDARWPHHRGNLLRDLGSRIEAANAYEKAIDLYAAENQLSRAISMAQVLLELEPARIDILERIAALSKRSSWGPPAPREHTVDADLYPPVDPDDLVEELTPDDVELISEPPGPMGVGVPADPLDTHHGHSVEYESLYPSAGSQPEPAVSPTQHPPSGPVTEPSPPMPGLAPAATPAEEISGAPSPAGPALFEATSHAPPVQQVPSPSGPLAHVSLLATLSPEVQERLLEGASTITQDAGVDVLNAGDPAETLFIVVKGHVTLTKTPDVEGMEMFPLETLEAGAVFGELCLLDDATVQTNASCASAVELLSIDKDVVDEVLSSHPALGEQLFSLLADRCLKQLLRTSELFDSLDEAMRGAAASLFEARRAEAGEHVLELGQRSSGLHILAAGSLLQHSAGDATTLLPVAVFGHGSLVGQQDAETTVTCMSDALLLTVPESRFAEFAALYPTVLMALAEYGSTPRTLRVSLPPPGMSG